MQISNRANTILLMLILAVGVGIIAMLASDARGGPLDPPGAPTSTDGVLEPGTPITSLPFEITEPGYYYLTRNLAGTPNNPGITLNATEVTIDLKGFTLQGGQDSVDGIVAPAGVTNIIIRNGTIRDWEGSGILFNFPTFSVGSTVYDLHVSNNGGHGIRLGDRAVIHDVTSRDNGLDGIATSRDATIERCTVSDNAGDGIDAPFNAVVTDCTVARNDGDGIKAGQGSMVRGNSVASNGGDGIQAHLSLVEQNVLLDNGLLVADGAGVRADTSRVVNNQLTHNDYGIAATASLVIGNFASNDDNWSQVTSSVFGPVLNLLTIDDAGANPHANFE